MKEKTFKIRIYTFSDFKQWIWNRLFLPKRNDVKEWICYHDSAIFDRISDVAYDIFCQQPATDEELRLLNEFEAAIRQLVKEQEQRTIRIIYS